MKTKKYILLDNDFEFNFEMPTGGVFEAKMKVKEGSEIKYMDDADATWVNLLKNNTPFSNATYWLTIKDLNKLGIAVTDDDVIPINKNTKKALKKYAKKILSSKVDDCFN